MVSIFKEFDLYSYKEGSDKPVDKFNHCMDALRYAVAYYFDSKHKVVVPHFYNENAESDDDDAQWQENIEKF